MEHERRQPLSDDDIDRIADAVAAKTRRAFQIDDEDHYNNHKRLDNMLKAYDSATNVFWKSFLALVITGMIILAGIVATKGIK